MIFNPKITLKSPSADFHLFLILYTSVTLDISNFHTDLCAMNSHKENKTCIHHIIPTVIMSHLSCSSFSRSATVTRGATVTDNLHAGVYSKYKTVSLNTKQCSSGKEWRSKHHKIFLQIVQSTSISIRPTMFKKKTIQNPFKEQYFL